MFRANTPLLFKEHFLEQLVERKDGMAQLSRFFLIELLHMLVEKLPDTLILIVNDFLAGRGERDDAAAAVLGVRVFLYHTVADKLVDDSGHLLFGKSQNLFDAFLE